MGFFNSKKEDAYFSQRYGSSQQTFSQSKQAVQSNPNEDDDYDIGIKFKKQLSNGSLIFLIVDDDFDWLGSYVVVSPTGIVNIVDNEFEYNNDDLNDIICERLKEKAKSFYDATVAID